jgi:hypothetical protein
LTLEELETAATEDELAAEMAAAARRQDVDQESADELGGGECHDLLAITTFGAIVLPSEGVRSQAISRLLAMASSHRPDAHAESVALVTGANCVGCETCCAGSYPLIE